MDSTLLNFINNVDFIKYEISEIFESGVVLSLSIKLKNLPEIHKFKDVINSFYDIQKLVEIKLQLLSLNKDINAIAKKSSIEESRQKLLSQTKTYKESLQNLPEMNRKRKVYTINDGL